MIRVILQGRTGNNLFQYAAGRALALKHNTGLILDGAWADARHARQFEQLLRLPIAARYERSLTLPKRLARRVIRLGPETMHRGPVIRDIDPNTPPDLTTAPDNSLLIGFFQGPAHAEDAEPELRRELDLSTLTIPEDSLRLEEQLRARPTISVHIRRGDYLAISNTNCLSPTYYPDAIEWFRQRIPQARFCLFSDDIPWCRSQFVGPDFLFCDRPASLTDPLHDLRLMASCHHHIIANSSYSWWGAWLNPAPDKLVVAPEWWMKDYPSKTIIPPCWHSL